MPPRQLTSEEMVGYLAGIIDGEGGIAMSEGSGGKNRKRVIYREIRIGNTDYSIIAATKMCLEAIDVHYTETSYITTTNRRCWYINIYTNKAFEKVLNLVPLQAEKKLETLEAIVNHGTALKRK